MNQKQRDRIAWILAAALAPIFIYLLATNVFRIGQRPIPPAAPPATDSAAPSPAVAPPAPGAAPPAPALEPAPDPKLEAEQRKIAARLPRRNPFSASAATAVARPAAAASPVLPVASAVRVTGFTSLGSKRMAVINGKLLGEGDRLGEWTVLKVNPQSRNVLLSNGARQVLVGAK